MASTGYKRTVYSQKIACLIHSLGVGGMERVMAILLRYFAKKKGLEVHLVLFGRQREILQTIPSSVKIHRPIWSFNNKRRIWHTFKSAAFIRNKVQSIEPDAILSFGEMWNNLVLLALTGLSYPVFVSDRSKPNKDLGKLQNRLRNRLYPRAAGYIAQTEKAKDLALQKGWNTNVCIIGNPIPVVNCQQDQENIILSVGRLIPTKNFDQLIHLYSRIENAEDWKLCIVGGDAKQMNISQQLAQQVTKLQLEDRVMLEGMQADVKPYYCQSKIFAFMSTSEGFPNVLGEAMAAGCACIAYDCIAGPSDIIDDNVNGFLIPLGDKDQYEEKLSLMMRDPSLRKRFGKAAREKMKHFEASFIAQQFYDFITEGIENRY